MSTVVRRTRAVRSCAHAGVAGPRNIPPDPAVGLTAADVADRVRRGRSNAFRPPSSRSVWSIVRVNVFNRFNAIIGICFLVLLAIGRWQDALFGFSAILNTAIGSAQEYRAKRALDRLAILNAPRARVRRDRITTVVAVGDVVLDDILVLQAGDQVAADAEVLESAGLQLDESMLTGESDPVDKDRRSEVLSGSVVVAGEGLARATRVGADAYVHRFASDVRRFSLVSSELRNSIGRILRWMSWIIPPVALLVLHSQMITAGGWGSALATGSWRQAAVGTIAAVVAMVPLGLVLITSIAFALGALRLSRSAVLAQELAAVECLARVDTICLDKTGTLTAGDIVLDEVRLLSAERSEGWDAVLGWYGAAPDANATARCLAARFEEPALPEPTGRIPFSSDRKWSSVSFSDGASGTWVLGGPDVVLPDPADGATARLVAEATESGRRVLVLAATSAGADGGLRTEEVLASGLHPVALLIFQERVRPDARETLDYFARQGVEVRILSGDDPRTAAAIAREVGLDAPTGYDARRLPADPSGMAAALRDNLVFGRVTPEQKREMIRALRSSGRTVAMTGDGVNDALAIKEADLGIAMNTASAATKAVAPLVLMDGRFAHLPSVVAEGRSVIANIERVSMLFLTKTAYATGLALVFGILILPFPILPRQESLVDGVTIGLPAFFLALIANAQRYRPGFLRRSLGFAIPAGAAIAAGLFVFTRLAAELGADARDVRTGTTLALILSGLWVLVVLSRPITPRKIVLIAGMIALFVGAYLLPSVRGFFDLADLPGEIALLVVPTAVVTIGAIEFVRFLNRRQERRSGGETQGDGT